MVPLDGFSINRGEYISVSINLLIVRGACSEWMAVASAFRDEWSPKYFQTAAHLPSVAKYHLPTSPYSAIIDISGQLDKHSSRTLVDPPRS